jgi:hypothetical protein
MSRRRATVASAVLLLSLISVPSGASAEEVDGVCDLEISLNGATTLLDNVVVEAYTNQEIIAIGKGFPTGNESGSPAAWVHFDFFVDGLPRSAFAWPIAADGSANQIPFNAFSFGHHGPVDAVGVEGEVRAIWLGEGEPCVDSVTLTHLGPVPFFSDIATSRFITEIVSLAEAGVIDGCAPGIYCPADYVTREEMAAFVDRALDLPATSADFFDDDEGSSLEDSINRVAAAGIVTGCGEREFCPGRRVTRAEMAAILVRGFELPPSDVNRFTDDDGHALEASINALAAARITIGCRANDPTRYCPDDFVRRDQMALFLYRALNPTP